MLGYNFFYDQIWHYLVIMDMASEKSDVNGPKKEVCFLAYFNYKKRYKNTKNRFKNV